MSNLQLLFHIYAMMHALSFAFLIYILFTVNSDHIKRCRNSIIAIGFCSEQFFFHERFKTTVGSRQYNFKQEQVTHDDKKDKKQHAKPIRCGVY